MPLVCAFDFEAFGGKTPSNGFTQLGAVILRMEDSKVISKFNMYANQKGFKKDKECIERFWYKYPDQFIKNLKETAISKHTPEEVVSKFYEWVKKSVPEGEECYFISDNPAFDAGILRTFSPSVDLMYVFGAYRDVVDVSMWYLGVTGCYMGVSALKASSKKMALAELNRRRANFVSIEKKQQKEGERESKKRVLESKGKEPLEMPVFDVKHTHDAVEDAEVIARYWAFFQREFKAVTEPQPALLD